MRPPGVAVIAKWGFLPGAAWQEVNRAFARWLESCSAWVLRPLASGQEADLSVLAEADGPQFVIETWRSGFPADAAAQYRFLLRARQASLPVPEPAAAGVDAAGRPVLVTRYGGEVAPRGASDLRRIAAVLATIHAAPTARLGLALHAPEGPTGQVPARYFPSLEHHADIAAACRAALAGVGAAPPRLVHGDFNLGNVLLRHGRITVIDWTNAALGDHRYDLAWALFLVWIYTGPEAYVEFLSGYAAAAGPVERAVLRRFEAVASLRWILLDRLVGLPSGRVTAEDVGRFVDARLPGGWRPRI